MRLMKRRIHPIAALIAIFALVFAQLATAAYACPQLAKAASVERHAPDCDHGANPDPNLCQRHCDDGKVSVETPKTFNPPVMATAFVLPIVVLAIDTSLRAEKRTRIATGPPPTRFTVLRI